MRRQSVDRCETRRCSDFFRDTGGPLVIVCTDSDRLILFDGRRRVVVGRDRVARVFRGQRGLRRCAVLVPRRGRRLRGRGHVRISRRGDLERFERWQSAIRAGHVTSRHGADVWKDLLKSNVFGANNILFFGRLARPSDRRRVDGARGQWKSAAGLHG